MVFACREKAKEYNRLYYLKYREAFLECSKHQYENNKYYNY